MKYLNEVREYVNNNEFKIVIVYLISVFFLFLISYFFNDMRGCLGIILAVVAINVVISFTDLRNRILLLLFNVDYFTLLLGRRAIAFISNDKWYLDTQIYIEKNTLLLLFFGIYFVFVGGLCYARYIKIKKPVVYATDTSNNKIILHKILLIIFIITLIPAVCQSLERVYFVKNNSYVELHSTFSSTIPFVLQKIGNMNTTFYYILLGALPDKKTISLAIGLNLLNLFLLLLSGSRGPIVINIIVLIFYFVYRQYNLNEIYFTKKTIIAGLLSSIFFIWFLGIYNNLRNGQDVVDGSFLDQIGNFFVSQSNSSEILNYVQIYEEQLPETNYNYTFGIVINSTFGDSYFIENTNTVKTALEGNNLGATISYLVLGDSFLRGHGLGTQYIAELYVDYSYCGVILYSLVLGAALVFLTNVKKDNLLGLALSLALISNLVYLPRQFAFGWVTYFLSITTILSVCITILLILITRRCHNEHNLGG